MTRSKQSNLKGQGEYIMSDAFKKEKKILRSSTKFIRIESKDKDVLEIEEDNDNTTWLLDMCDRCGIKDPMSYNPALFDKEFLNLPKAILPGPLAFVEFRVLAATYKRNAHVDELKHLSGQVAKVLQNLRDKGFIPDQHKDNSNFYMDKNHRMFTGWISTEYDNRKLLPDSKARKILLEGKRDPFTHSRQRLEIDHRTPLKACKRLDILPARLTSTMVRSETFSYTDDCDPYFQVITRARNAEKREACDKCLAGKTIPIPEVASVLEKFKGNFKRKWDIVNTTTQSCIGCFHYNSNLTQDEYLSSTKDDGTRLIDLISKQGKDLNNSILKLKEYYNGLYRL